MNHYMPTKYGNAINIPTDTVTMQLMKFRSIQFLSNENCCVPQQYILLQSHTRITGFIPLIILQSPSFLSLPFKWKYRRNSKK